MSVIRTTFDNYNRMGDVAVVAICCVIFILLASSYVSRTTGFRIFATLVGDLLLAAVINIGFHDLLLFNVNDASLNIWIYILRIVYVILLFNAFFLFSLYTSVISNLEHRKAKIYTIVALSVFLAAVAGDIMMSVHGVGFHFTENGLVVPGFDIFMIGYIVYVLFLVFQLLRIRKLLFKRVMYGFFGVMTLSVLIRVSQFLLNQSALTTMSFLLPAIAMLYIMHSNPYNAKVGTLDVHVLEDMVRRLYKRNTSFVFLSLLWPDYDVEGKHLPDEIQAMILNLSREYFRNGVLFLLSNGHILMIATKKNNPDYEDWLQTIIAAFQQQYEKLRFSFKLVYGESVLDISQQNEYMELIESIHTSMPMNTIHRLNAEDTAKFSQREYILSELKDICRKRDLNDPRVLAYCQPVYNCQTGTFDSAEALMRLNLDKTGVVFPDSFISLAEGHGYIHVLTEIILHKTCRAIQVLLDAGYAIGRISVNMSALELRVDEFCDDVEHIIQNVGISSSKIAIELTESHSESDFVIMKEKIEKLHRQGIQFYLDDFGTGYSNMERIMELPFDIIKFDRTMLTACDKDDRSVRMVNSLANMFRDMSYSVLYEGVENEGDEALCRGMSANFLQGYKYSRPIPIEQLREFLPRAV